jgi:hypothetical protein
MTYMGAPYYPLWLDNLADDCTLEGAAMEGTARGAETVHSIVVTARSVYDEQTFSYAGPVGDNNFLEEYSCLITGAPTRVVVSVHRNAAGQTQELAVLHRPRSSVLLFSRLMGEKFAGTPTAAFFLTDGS